MTRGSTNWLLVDTNLLVYAYDPRDRRKQEAARNLLNELQSTGRGGVSLQVLGELFHTLTRRLVPPLTSVDAERRVINISLNFHVIEPGLSTVVEAIRGSRLHQMSYWDALIWATARVAGIPTVLTEDIQSSAAIEGVSFVNPFGAGFDLSSL